jgi:hypothetical protein
MKRIDLIFSVIQNPTGCAIDKLAMLFRDNLDMVNAVQLLETLGGDVGSYHRIKQEAAISKGIPALLSAFMPKSGGTYLHNSLVRLGAVDIYHATQSPIDHYQTYLIESWLRVFLRGGSTCHSHMPPTPHNLEVLRRSSARRLWVHARDPRQSALSSYWHEKGIGLGRGIKATERLKALDEVAPKIASAEHAMGLIPLQESTFEEKIKFRFLQAHQWASDWIHAKQLLKDIDILFTTFEEFIANQRSFEKKVKDFFGWQSDLPIIFQQVHDEDRFRTGSTDEWKGVYDKSLCLWLEDRIDPMVYDAFGWQVW